MIARIAVAAANFAIDKPYSYAVPRGMDLQPGMRVQVPFGRGNRQTEGIVLSLAEGEEKDLKAVQAALDLHPVLDDTMLHLAAFLRDRYFCTFYDGARAMLPAGLWFEIRETWSLTDDVSWKDAPPSKGLAVLQTLEAMGGSADGAKLRESFPGEELPGLLSYLQRKKLVACSSTRRRKINDKTEQIATLAVSAEETQAFAMGLPKSAAMQRAVLQTMCSVGSVAVKELCYFTGASTATVRRLESLGYLTLTERECFRCHEIRPAQVDGLPVLNEEQTAAFEGLQAQLASQKPGGALLYGVTGSGKTAVYLNLIRKTLDMGKSAILMVPEIALTPQLLGLVSAHFGQTVAVLHSSLAASERYDQWKRVRSGEARVVVGTRSAVFAPCRDLGLIILDEEQERSYISENSPRYAAKEVALWRGSRQNALVLMGSATPSVETMYHALAGRYSLYKLKNRYGGRPLPKVEIVDLRHELQEGNDLALSYPLLEAMRDTYEAGKQTVLFLNRRGNSRSLLCVDCGKAPECPRCSQRLTYHSANNRLMCHYCGFSRPVPDRCECGGRLKQVGVGTQKVVQQLQTVCPEYTVDRMDADTVSAVNTHEKILDHFQKEKVSVLLGTQMVAKGLNLPNVTLVGVLDADLSLYADSFRAAETTFHMLTQVVGRSGRGDTDGRAMIQTLSPQHQVIRLAARQDYDAFYQMEIELRRLQGLPPFRELLTLQFSGLEEAAVLRGAAKFRDSLAALCKQPPYLQNDATVLGPAPCAVAKINYYFRYRLTLQCRMDRNMATLLAHLLRQFAADRENRGVSLFVDTNGAE